MKDKTSIPLLKAETPLFSRELLRPLRLLSLAAGIALLIAGSIYLPSTDWDIPICFIMGIPAYVLAPWVFRQVFNFRWKWLLPAALALWFAIDGTYSAYWHLRGFDALAVFRPANYFYCIWLFWACGFVWNIDCSKIVWSRKAAGSAEAGVPSVAAGRNALARFLGAVILAVALSLLVAGIVICAEGVHGGN